MPERLGELEDIVRVLIALLPEAEVSTEEETLRRVNTATYATAASSRVVVRPAHVEEVSRLMRWATERRVRVYVISRGRNWGLGSCVPVEDVVLLLDLGRMDRVLAYDARHGTLRVQPGVTFSQAARFLREAGDQHMLSAIGGSPHASLLGNLLERGDGVGPLWDRPRHACAFEVVLPDGERVHLGYDNQAGSRVAGLSRDGVGPGTQDLFVQSNLGVVTAATLHLQRKPEHLRSFWFPVPGAEGLPSVLECLRELLQRRVLSGPVVLWNDYKQAASHARYPWAQTGGRTPLERGVLRAMSDSYCAWLCFGGIHVDHRVMSAVVLRELRRVVRGALGPGVAVTSLSTEEVARLEDEAPELARQWHESPLFGVLSEAGPRSLYWRKRMPPPPHPAPDADGCGVLWDAFEAPLEGELLAQLAQQLEEKVLHHGFEPMFSLCLVDERRVKCFLQVLYDRSLPGEDERAWTCHEQVFEALESQGFTHSRVDTRHMARMRQGARGTVLRDRIAAALDPAGILSPGRYAF